MQRVHNLASPMHHSFGIQSQCPEDMLPDLLYAAVDILLYGSLCACQGRIFDVSRLHRSEQGLEDRLPWCESSQIRFL